MVFKFVIVCASAFLLQSACSQYIGSGSTVTGNSVVDNNIYLGGSGIGLSNGGLVGIGSGSGFASGSGYASSGSLGSGIISGGSLGSGIVSSGSLGSGIVSSGSLGSGIVNSGSLGSGIVSSGSLGSGIVSSGSLGSGIVSSGSLGSGIVTGGLKGHSTTVTSGGLSGHNIVASSPLTVTSFSPIGPSGLAVASENTLEGILTVSGQLPFLSAVAFEGGLPTAGSGVATCGCGSGDVAITSEGLPQVTSRGLRY